MINKTDTKRAVPLVLTAALLLSGCGVNGTSAGQNQKPDGVQEETQVQTAEVKKVAILSTAESRIVADSTDIKAGTGIAYQDTDFSTPEDYFYKYSNVDYGEIDDRVTYYSSTIGEDKQCGVLLPPRYDTSKKYPVVYTALAATILTGTAVTAMCRTFTAICWQIIRQFRRSLSCRICIPHRQTPKKRRTVSRSGRHTTNWCTTLKMI
mgnify:CR=1 FL=1